MASPTGRLFYDDEDHGYASSEDNMDDEMDEHSMLTLGQSFGDEKFSSSSIRHDNNHSPAPPLDDTLTLDAAHRESLLELLETRFGDSASLTLAEHIRTVSQCHDATALRLMVQRVDTLEFRQAVNANDWNRSLVLFSLEALKHLHHLSLNLVLQMAFELSEHIEYWKDQLEHPFRAFMRKGPRYWYQHAPQPRDVLHTGLKPWLAYMSYQQRMDVYHVINRLEEWRDRLLRAAGALHRTNWTLKTRQDIHVSMLVECASALHSFLGHNSGQHALRESRGANSTPQRCLRILQDTAAALSQYRNTADKDLAQLRKPDHWQLYWLQYAVGAVAAGFAVYQVYSNREAIGGWITESYSGLCAFVSEHVIKPLSDMYSYVFRTFRGRQLSTSLASLKQDEASLSNMLYNFADANASSLAKGQNMSEQAFRDSIRARARQNDMSLVMTSYEQEIQRPLRGAVAGDLVQGMLIQVQKLKVDTESAMLAADQLLQSNGKCANVCCILCCVVLCCVVLYCVVLYCVVYSPSPPPPISLCLSVSLSLSLPDRNQFHYACYYPCIDVRLGCASWITYACITCSWSWCTYSSSHRREAR
jgi:uncharacterized membrane protein (DUF2068 family)